MDNSPSQSDNLRRDDKARNRQELRLIVYRKAKKKKRGDDRDVKLEEKPRFAVRHSIWTW